MNSIYKLAALTFAIAAAVGIVAVSDTTINAVTLLCAFFAIAITKRPSRTFRLAAYAAAVLMPVLDALGNGTISTLNPADMTLFDLLAVFTLAYLGLIFSITYTNGLRIFLKENDHG